jgi:L-fucose dehydrogenase
MLLALNGKVFLITGGAQGIGAAIARACGDEGGLPVIVDRDAVATQNLKTELDQRRISSEFIAGDLTNSAAISRAIKETGERLGRIDGLVNNAGVNDGVGLENGNPDKFAASLERNLIHYFAVTQAVLPFLKQTHGSIVNIASKVAITGQGGTSGYAASKGAILGLTRGWASELSDYGIRVNCVVPAEVMTPLYEKWLKTFEDPEERRKKIAAKIPLHHRMTEPAEIAAMAVFLLSEKSAGITGQHLFVDGGYVHLDRVLT